MNKDWKGIELIGEVNGVKIYYDSYHPEQTLTVELNSDKTEMVYIISPYDDITVFEGIKKNIIVSEKPTNMIKELKKLSFNERCRIANYTPFNIEYLIGELSKKKKESYITQEEFEEFHHTIMDGLNITRYADDNKRLV